MANTHHLTGTGPHKVIALHGWFGDQHAFAPMEAFLTGSEFTYAFMDYRGCGGMKDVAGAFTMDEIAADTLALADALGWREFSLIGHSMGGMAIQRVLTRAPSRVKKLVGITPVPASGSPFDDAGWALFSGAAENAANRYAHHRLHHRQPPVADVDQPDGREFPGLNGEGRIRCVSASRGRRPTSAPR